MFLFSYSSVLTALSAADEKACSYSSCAIPLYHYTHTTSRKFGGRRYCNI